MYGTSASAVSNNAYNEGCTFAKQHSSGTRLLILDFGAARTTSRGGGALDFNGLYVSNPAILSALESASNGVTNCYTGGVNVIAYGNSNYHMTQAGMTTTDAVNAGFWQSQRADALASYQISNGRTRQATAIAVDMEPAWDLRPISNDLVNGANKDYSQFIYDYGSADGCPQSGSAGNCYPGWTTFDVAWASFSGLALPLPEMYYSFMASQWTVVRKNWDNRESAAYYFGGTTGSTGVPLTPQQGWNALSAADPGLVDSELVCFGC
jgi:hypothetical protein